MKLFVDNLKHYLIPYQDCVIKELLSDINKEGRINISSKHEISCRNLNTEVPTIADYINQYFKLNFFYLIESQIFLKTMLLKKTTYFSFKILVDIVRNSWYLCEYKIVPMLVIK